MSMIYAGVDKNGKPVYVDGSSAQGNSIRGASMASAGNPTTINAGVSASASKIAKSGSKPTAIASTTKPQTYTPNSGSSGSGGDGYSTSNYYADLLEYYKQQNESARQSAIDAIRKALSANIDVYNNQMKQSDDQYASLINQSEAQRYRSSRSLRETQANRGQLDSGLARGERLNMDTKYANQLSNIILQRQNARDSINSSIAQAKAQAQSDEAQVNNSYAQALAQYMNNLR